MERLGLCLDTAHLWGAGYDCPTITASMGSCRASSGLLGREHVVMLHLNDSRTTLGLASRSPRAHRRRQGRSDGMRELLTHPWLSTLPTFLETPGMDIGYDRSTSTVRAMLIDGETPAHSRPRRSKCTDPGPEPRLRQLNGP